MFTQPILWCNVALLLSRTVYNKSDGVKNTRLFDGQLTTGIKARTRRVAHNFGRFTGYTVYLSLHGNYLFIVERKHHIERQSFGQKLPPWAKQVQDRSTQIAEDMKGASHRRRLMNNIEYYLDEYDYYNFDPVATAVSHSRKGRSKKEASLNTNRHNPAGHERKVLTKLQNTEKKRKELNIRTSGK